MKNAIINAIIDSLKNMQGASIDGIGNAADNLVSWTKNACSSSIFSGLQALATSLLVCYFLIYLANDTMRNKNDADNILKTIALCFLYGMILINLDTLVPALASVAKSFVDIITSGAQGLISSLTGNSPTQNAFNPEDMKDSLKDKNLILLIFDLLLYNLIGGLATMIVSIIAKVAIYTVELELLVRAMTFPIGVASLPSDGWQGAGGRYIRGFFGCFLQIGVIAVCLQMYQLLMGESMGANSANTLLVTILAAGFACAGMCMKASSIAKEVAGA